MSVVFNLIYLFLMLLLSPWIAWRVLFQGKNRRGWAQKLFGLAPVRISEAPCVWLHAVSVGEVNLLYPFINELKRKYPNIEFAISTSTETGFDLANKRYPEHVVFFCPADFSWAVRNCIKRIKPDLLLLTELEIWPNLVSITRSSGIPVALVNGRISESSFRGYSRLHFLFSHLLNQLNVAIVQSPTYAQRLSELGMQTEKIAVSGNLKFDGLDLAKPSENEIDLASSNAGLGDEDFIFVAGSTQENEDLIAISIYEKLKPKFPQLRLVLVPRHPDRTPKLVSFLNRRSIPLLQRSKSNIKVPGEPVVIVDVIGELQHWWSKANLAYVGGSMNDRGGQNMIEPAALGIPVCFGPNTANFKDIVELLLAANAAQVVRDARELEQWICWTIENPSKSIEMGNQARRVVEQQRGACFETVILLEKIWSLSKQNTAIKTAKAA